LLLIKQLKLNLCQAVGWEQGVFSVTPLEEGSFLLASSHFKHFRKAGPAGIRSPGK